MKKTFLIIATLLIGSTVFGQTTVPNLISTQDRVERVSVSTDKIITYQTVNGIFDYVCNDSVDVESTTILPNVNMTEDVDGNIYELHITTDEFNITLNGNPYGTSIDFDDIPLNDCSDMEIFFDDNNVLYLDFIGKFDGDNRTYLSFYDLFNFINSPSPYYSTIIEASSIQRVSDSNSDYNLYYSDGNEIFELETVITSTNNNTTIQSSSVLYDVDVAGDQPINDFFYDGSDMFMATHNGVYSTYSRECDEDVITGINDETNDENETYNDVNLYPNPNNGTFTINNIENGTSIKVISSTGQLVYNSTVEYSNTKELELNVPTGIYFVQLSNETTTKTIKFIKQ